MKNLYRILWFLILVITFLTLAGCGQAQDSSQQVSDPTLPLTPVQPAAVSPTASSPTPMPGVLRVVYFKDGYVTLWTDGQGSRQLVESNAEQVRISDDGQVIASLGTNSSGTYGLFAVNADGTSPRLLVGQDYLQSLQPAGKIVAFDFAPASHTLYFVTDQYDLHRIEAANGSPVLVFGAGRGGFFSFSPDGQWMVLYHSNELVLAHRDGSGARVVFQYPEGFGYTMIGPEIIWKPDSSGFQIASASGPQGSSDSMTVWFIPLAGDPVKQISYAGPYGANLAPDGRQVVYLYFQHEPVDVHVIAPDGKDTLYNSYDTATYPAIKFMGWAPDSQHFLLNLGPDGRLTIPHLAMLGEQPVKLTDTDNAGSVVWVDAQRILFVSHGAPAGDTLHLQRVGEPSMLVDTVHSSMFDHTFTNP